MKNIFNKEDNKELIERLHKITVTSEKKWGKMTVSQMLAHCQKPLEVAENKLVIKRNLISLLFGKMMKKKLIINGEDFKQNLPTAKEFKMDSSVDFEKEKETLLKMVIAFGEKGSEIVVMETHPFFGNMTPNEWGILFYKHIDHHLNQFRA